MNNHIIAVLKKSLSEITEFISQYFSIFDKNIDFEISLLRISKDNNITCNMLSNFYDEELFIHSIYTEIKKNNIIKKSVLKKVCMQQLDSEVYELYISQPIPSEQAYYYLLLHINKDVFSKFPSLKTNRLENIDVPVSFIKASIVELINYFSNLKSTDKKLFLVDPQMKEKLYTDAARNFINRLEFFSSDMKEESTSLFDNLNKLSSLNYEKKEARASILFSFVGNSTVEYDIEFDEPIKLTEYRKIRKLLELGTDQLSLISNGTYVYGLGRESSIDSGEETVFKVMFLKYCTWSIMYDSKELLKYEFGHIFSPSYDNLQYEDLHDNISRIFNKNDSSILTNMTLLVHKAIKNNYSTTIIFCKNAKEEAERLYKSSFVTLPFFISKSNIASLSSVDGAILIDDKCVCHAFGVILDGIAIDNADSSRGSRFNSALRYYEHYKKIRKTNEIMIVVISDDGMVDYLPKLRKRIKKNDVEDRIKNLKNSINNNRITLPIFRKNIKSLYSLSFYLSKEQCEEINVYINKANSLLQNISPTEYNYFKQHKDWDNSYIL